MTHILPPQTLPPQTLPLSHIKILDLTTIIAGPFCTLHLAHMGAEIIKIEPLGTGDSGRNLGSDENLNNTHMGALFLGMNMGKKSITLNLKTDEGIDIFKKMVAQCDVVVENFRAGVMDKLGLSFETLKIINPKIIYCSISGYGQQGPMSNRAAYDQIVQGLSGMMAATGEPPADGERPVPYRVGAPIADTITGLTSAFAIAAALNDPHRQATFLDMSMLESTISSMGWALSEYTVCNKNPKQEGNHSAISAPSGTFRTKDGMMNIATNTQQQWIDLATHLGHPEWIDMPEFKDRKSRRDNRPLLIEYIESVLCEKNTDEWVAGIAQLKIPVGEILQLGDTLNLPQIQQRGLLQDFDIDGIDTPVKLVKPAVSINNCNPDFDTPPQVLSNSTQSVLQDMLQMDDAQIEKLVEKNVIALPSHP